jgi:NADH:ubiquinone oxidoreductase subunit H
MHPLEDLMQAVDNIQATFHQILYHPDAMMAFASVLMEFTVIPVGSIFGSRNSPLFFTLLLEP